MKIKTKKQLNLPQLIEWAWDYGIRDTFVDLKSEYPAKQGIEIDKGGRLHLVGMDYLSKSNTFTIEVEEEITEDTVIDEMLLVFNNGVTHLVENRSLNSLDTSCLKSAYSMNDDLRLILIWRDGGLVE